MGKLSCCRNDNRHEAAPRTHDKEIDASLPRRSGSAAGLTRLTPPLDTQQEPTTAALQRRAFTVLD